MDDVPLDLILSTGDHETIDSAVEQAQLAEDLGFSRVSAGEVTGWNIMPLLSVIAERTDEIGISDDVISSYSRTPALLGQTALTMHDVTDGRFRLGLGASSPALAEKWHGQSFDRPLRRLRETIDIVREVYDGGDVAYEGEIFEIGGLSYDRSPSADPPAIDVATLGPKATELTGRFADGWVPQLFTPDGLRDRLEDLRRGADLGDRDPADLRVTPIIRCFASEDRETARSVTRQMVAFLVGAYGPFYGNSVAEQGYEDEVEAIRAAWDDRDMAAMSAEIDDEMLDSLAAAGTPEEVRERVRTFAAIDGVDAIRVGFAAGMDQDAKRSTMEALAGAD
jgi:coenzyme F420-dependent oxidoreductase